VATLIKLAHALGVPLYEIFHDGSTPVQKLQQPSPTIDDNYPLWGGSGKERHELKLFAKALARIDHRSRNFLMKMAATMANPGNQ